MRSHIFIDGANLYHAIKDEAQARGHAVEIDYTKLPTLVNNLTGSEVLRTSFFTGIPAEPTHKERAFIDRLERTPDFEVKTKPLLHHEGRLYEKGVDVLIAVDMLWNGLKGYCDEVVLVSGDADLVEAVKRLMDNGVRVVVAMFHEHVADILERAADEFIDLGNHLHELEP